MRKINRGCKPARKSGPRRTDRTEKPGFRPKGNNRGTERPVRRPNQSEEDGRERPSRSAGRPSVGRSSDTRSRGGRSGDDRRGPSQRSGGTFSRRSSDERSSRTSYRAERSSPDRSEDSSRSGRTGSSIRSYRSDDAPRARRTDDAPRARRSDDAPRARRTDDAPRARRTDDAPRARRTDDAPRPRRTDDSPRPRRTDDSPRLERAKGERPYRGSDRKGKTFSSPRRSGGRDGFAKKPFRRAGKTADVKEGDGLTRLNKFIANCGICSRREADDLIKAGVISVNGHVITEMGYKVNPGDEVRYNNTVLRGERPVYLLLNKPKDYITTVDDPGQRHTVMELVAGACKERIYPVGRLDRNTTGVLLFTNDGDLARKLMHPSFHVQKVYHVSLDGSLKPDEMDRILQGIHLEDGPINADDIAYAGDGTDRKEIGIELHSGRNRIVRRIFEFFGHSVTRLDRTVFAGLTKKDLPRGRWRFLTEMEVNQLKMQVGDKKTRRFAPAYDEIAED